MIYDLMTVLLVAAVVWCFVADWTVWRPERRYFRRAVKLRAGITVADVVGRYVGRSVRW